MRRGRRARHGQSAAVGATIVGLTLAGCSSGGGGGGSTVGGGGGTSSGSPSSSATSSSPSASSGASHGTSPLGVKWATARQDRYTGYLTSLKGTTTFQEIVWCNVEETPGHPNWRKTDRLVKTTERLGINLVLKIRVGACWATGGAAKMVRGKGNKTESAMPTDLGAYAQFVRQVATRYGPQGVHTYAIENEVNSESFWDDTPQDYIRLTETAAHTLRAVDPQNQVVDAGMSSTSYGYGIADRLLRASKDAAAVAAFNTYFERRIGTRGEQIPHVSSVAQLRSVLDSAQGRRNLSYLAAARTLAERGIVNVRQVHFYEPSTAVPLLLDYLKAETPANVPIEAWEVGSFWKDASASDAARAQEMARTVALLLAGGVKEVIWLPLASNENNRHGGAEIRYGLLAPDGTVRSAGALLAQLVAASRGATVEPVTGGGLQGVAFSRSGASTLLVWSRQAGVRLDVGSGASTLPAGQSSQTTVPGTTTTVGRTPELVHTDRSVQQVTGTTG